MLFLPLVDELPDPCSSAAAFAPGARTPAYSHWHVSHMHLATFEQVPHKGGTYRADIWPPAGPQTAAG